MSARVRGPISGVRPPVGGPRRDLAEVGYVCEEFQLEGTAVAYRHRGGARPTPDGRWEAEVDGEAPYRTRILVVRPGDPARFNGTVVVHWQNVSAGREYGFVDDAELCRGYAWVGVSAQEIGLYGAPMGALVRGQASGRGLIDVDPERYSELYHPGDAGSFEIFGQATQAVGPRRACDPDPLCGLDVRRVVATGGSQSAMRLVAYANAVHARHRVIDGFVLSTWEGRAPRLEEGAVALGVRTLLRSDPDVPVLVVNSEFEAMAGAALELPDGPLLRVWEVAGTAHGTVRRAVVGAREWQPNPLSWAPVERAALRGMHAWLADGVPPSSQPRIATHATGQLARDELGNASGGIRLPELAAPLATYRGMSTKTGYPPLYGGYRPFPAETVRSLYQSTDSFLLPWARAIDGMLDANTLIPEDAAAMRERGHRAAERAILSSDRRR